MRAVAALVAVVALAAPAAARAAAPQLSAVLDERAVGLGDRLRYTVEARVETGEAVGVTADLGPFTAVAPPKLTRSRRHGVTIVRLEQFLVCLDRGCAPGAKPRQVKLPRATARWAGGSAAAAPATVTLVPRVPASAVAASRARYRADTGLPAGPGLGVATAVSAVAAACLALGALALGAWALRRPRAVAAAARRVVSFDEAARFLRESAARPAPDRRRAADFAVRASTALGDRRTAGDAARVAWAPPDPEPADVDALADRLEQGSAAE
jgi:hypothetical protein